MAVLQTGDSFTEHDNSRVATAYATEILASPDSSGSDSRSDGMFGSTTRIILAISAAALLILSYFGAGSNGAANLKDLSDKVTHLTLQLNNKGIESTTDDEDRVKRELSELEHQLEEKKIELAWEKEKVENHKLAQEIMFESMAEQITHDQQILTQSQHTMHELGHKAGKFYHELGKETEENVELKKALANALEELANARAQLPPAPDAPLPGGESNKDYLERMLKNKSKQEYLERMHKNNDHGESVKVDTDHKEEEVADPSANRNLRVKTGFQPGDNIEIIEYQEGGKVALRPGIVSDKNSDGTFNVVKLEQSIMIPHQKASSFQTYHIYHQGMSALFEVAQETYVPVTIVEYVQGSARPHFELHGAYKFTKDDDPEKIERQGSGMRMHRYAGVGEIIETGADRDNNLMMQQE